LIAALTGLVIALSPGVAQAHARLTRAEPAAGSNVKAPAAVTLEFTENLEGAFSTIEVRNTKGERVDAGRASASGSRLQVKLKPLAPGRYTVRWRVLSVDTHRSEGNFSFDVSP
jgi:methionine-rich copper-binding protein CopC